MRRSAFIYLPTPPTLHAYLGSPCMPDSHPPSLLSLLLLLPMMMMLLNGTHRWILRKEEKAAGDGGGRKRQEDILDRILGAVEEKQWGPQAIRQMRDEVCNVKKRERALIMMMMMIVCMCVYVYVYDSLQIKTFILAGHETSASMLTWALYEIIQNPKYMSRVIGEADDVFGKDNHANKPLPPSESFNNLVFTQCCLKVGR